MTSMIQSTVVTLLPGLMLRGTKSGPVIAIILSIVFCEIFSVSGGLESYEGEGDPDRISQYARASSQVLDTAAVNWSSRATEEKQSNSSRDKLFTTEDLQQYHGPQQQGKSHGNSSTSGHTNNISDYIRKGELSAIFCERCTDSQKEKVEQILYLLYNFNNNNNNAAVSDPLMPANADSKQYTPAQNEPDKQYILFKKKNRKFKATSSPVPIYRKNLPEMIPTPETMVSPNNYHNNRQLSGVIQLPSSFSTTTPSTSSPGYSSMAIPIVPYFYSPSSTSPLPASSTTVSSALEPAQSVEMPTPPVPPTTSGPVYLYYLGGGVTSSSSSLSSSGSLETPSTPVMESSVAYASRPTTIEPKL